MDRSKGFPHRGESGGDAAVREAEEEAGLIGELTREPIGRYCYSKQVEHYEVDVYVMRVTIVLSPGAKRRIGDGGGWQSRRQWNG